MRLRLLPWVVLLGCSREAAQQGAGASPSSSIAPSATTSPASSGATSGAPSAATSAEAKSFRTRTKKNPKVSSPTPAKDWGGGTLLNPTDASGRTIVTDRERCFALVDENAHGTQVDCPPSMDDEAWDACQGRLYRLPKKNECVCAYLGCSGDAHCKVPAVRTLCPK